MAGYKNLPAQAFSPKTTSSIGDIHHAEAHSNMKTASAKAGAVYKSSGKTGVNAAMLKRNDKVVKTYGAAGTTGLK